MGKLVVLPLLPVLWYIRHWDIFILLFWGIITKERFGLWPRVVVPRDVELPFSGVQLHLRMTNGVPPEFKKRKV